MFYETRNQPAKVLACAARAAKHWQDSTPFKKATAVQLRGHGHRLNKDYPAAITAYREVVENRRSISPEGHDVAIDLNWLAGAERLNKDYPAAERDYREALRIVKKTLRREEGEAEFTGNLALLAIDRELWAEAESLAREALALAEKVGRQELIALDCHHLAQALLKQNSGVGATRPVQESALPDREGSPLHEALSLSHRAVEIFTRLRHPDLPKAQETLAEIEQALVE